RPDPAGPACIGYSASPDLAARCGSPAFPACPYPSRSIGRGFEDSAGYCRRPSHAPIEVHMAYTSIARFGSYPPRDGRRYRRKPACHWSLIILLDAGIPPSGHSCTSNVTLAFTLSPLSVVWLVHNARRLVSVPW